MSGIDQFEKRGKAYIGHATMLQCEGGDEVIIMAASMEALVRAVSQTLCMPIDTSLTQHVAVIAANRVSETGSIVDERATSKETQA